MNKCLYCGSSVKNKYCNTSCQNRHQKRKPTKEQLKKSVITRYGEIKEFKVNCFKCRKEFFVEEREKLFPQKEKYYCSRSCANTRQHTDESKLKTSKSIKKLILDGNPPGCIKISNDIKLPIIKICNNCNEEFSTSRINQKFCSTSCSSKFGNGWKHVHDKITTDEWSIINKKSYDNGHNHVAGGTCNWYDYKNIRVQGTYELRSCFILDKWKENNKIKNWEYTNDRIKYIGIDNKIHSYLLDFKVFDKDGTFYYIETKGYVRENDELKWDFVRKLGHRLDIWFEKDIERQEMAFVV